MAEIVYMPKLSDTMTEGVVASWIKNVGDSVKNGEIIAEIETDKATMEFESFYDGVLLYIGVDTGKTAPVNAILAIIGEKGEDISGLLSGAAAAATTTTEKIVVPETPIATPAPTVKAEPLVETSKPAPIVAQNTSVDRVFASPLAKKLAEEKGIDISFVAGTGEFGRITKRDVDHYIPYNGQQKLKNTSSVGI